MTISSHPVSEVKQTSLEETVFLGSPEMWWSSSVFSGVWCLMWSPLHQWWAKLTSVVNCPAEIDREVCSDLRGWWSSWRTSTWPPEKRSDGTRLGSLLTQSNVKVSFQFLSISSLDHSFYNKKKIASVCKIIQQNRKGLRWLSRMLWGTRRIKQTQFKKKKKS